MNPREYPFRPLDSDSLCHRCGKTIPAGGARFKHWHYTAICEGCVKQIETDRALARSLEKKHG